MIDMTAASKKQIGTVLLFLSSALLAFGATLMAYDGSPLEDSGVYVVVIGLVVMALGFAGILLNWNTQQCDEPAKER